MRGARLQSRAHPLLVARDGRTFLELISKSPLSKVARATRWRLPRENCPTRKPEARATEVLKQLPTYVNALLDEKPPGRIVHLMAAPKR
jgi:hypothetical protein